MLQHLACLYRFNLDSARSLVRDLTPEQMVAQPQGLINHPAWSLGHLTLIADYLATLLGHESQAPAGWGKTFATGGTPSGVLADYPSKDELLAALAAQHERTTGAVLQADPTWFTTPHAIAPFRKNFPTQGDLAMFMMTSHEMDHLGQMAAWRRAMGLGPARRA